MLRSLVSAGETVVAVEPFHAGTLAFQLAEALADRPARIVEIGVPRETISGYGTVAEIDARIGREAAGIAERLRRLV